MKLFAVKISGCYTTRPVHLLKKTYDTTMKGQVLFVTKNLQKGENHFCCTEFHQLQNNILFLSFPDIIFQKMKDSWFLSYCVVYLSFSKFSFV